MPRNCARGRGERGDNLAIISFQINRFKTVNDQHGYETGDRLLKMHRRRARPMSSAGAVIARLSGDEFAVALALGPSDMAAPRRSPKSVLRAVTRPFMFDERIIQVGAFAGIAVGSRRATRAFPISCAAPTSRMDHARSGRVARPVWFDAGMERALIAQGEIEQGIRFGLEHGQFVPYFEPQVDLATGEIVGFEVLARWNHPLSGIIGPTCSSRLPRKSA